MSDTPKRLTQEELADCAASLDKWMAQATEYQRVAEREHQRADTLSDTLDRWHKEIDAVCDRAGVALGNSENAHQEPLARLVALSEKAERADAAEQRERNAEAQARELADALKAIANYDCGAYLNKHEMEWPKQNGYEYAAVIARAALARLEPTTKKEE